jgi:hypothetical protein
MPLRFRRTLKIAPGVKLNFSKSGVSTTVGPKGFHFTFGKRGVRRTVSIPGTGVSEVDYIKKNKSESEKDKEERSEDRREARLEDKGDEKRTNASKAEKRPAQRRRSREATATSGSAELRNAFVLLGIVVFFFAGAAMLGLMPAHFLSNSLQYLVHIVQGTGL